MILYVTSFNKKLYDSTGKDMLKSLHETNPKAKILVTYEGFDFVAGDNEIGYNLADDAWLKAWTEKFKKYIPLKYGGQEDPQIKFEINLHFPANNDTAADGRRVQRKLKVLAFRAQTARWFRKIVALRAAMKYISPEMVRYIVFVDSDTLFRHELSVSLIEKAFNKTSAFVHYGQQRTNLDIGIESGFIGFDIFNGGLHFLEKVFQCYESGNFLHYKRWDDSYVFAKVIQEKNIRVNDLVKTHIREAGGHVVKHGPFANYIEHKKGIHTRTNIV